MPPAGDYLFTNTGFSNDKPVLSLYRDGTFYDFSPLDTVLTLSSTFDQRHCTGWRDITNGERHSCPQSAVVDSKYDQCSGCQQRTGFNPAFYHATTVSPQQEARNQEPHILYLAYFGGNLIKVGISHAARGNSRLLEQGARAAIILDTFPTAHIARQYEARIAALPGIAETVAMRQKINALPLTYTPEALATTKANIEASINVSFNGNELLQFDNRYFPTATPDLSDIVTTTDQRCIAGEAVGLLGSLLCCRQQDATLIFPLKTFVGYTVTLAHSSTDLDLPMRQASLF